jgi:hypothetical protein
MDKHFDMLFTLANKGRAAASRVELEIYDTGLNGERTGGASTYVLTGHFQAGSTTIREENVPAPPPYRMAKFSKYDCRVTKVVFDE